MCGQSEGLEQVEILSDTRGLDFGPYLRRVVKSVRDNWYSLIPPSAYPPTKKHGRVAIEFAIQSDGTIKSEKVEVSSGDVTLDQAAFAGIRPLRFDLLPKDYSGQQLNLRFSFLLQFGPGHLAALHFTLRRPSFCWFHVPVFCSDGRY
jgi:TonB family protein